jgi:hypothetical protein
MRKPICLAVVCLAALLTPSVAAATPLPDASPQAHGRHVTVLPACPEVPIPWNVKHAYVEIWQGNTILCASLEGNRYAATMTFNSQPKGSR